MPLRQQARPRKSMSNRLHSLTVTNLSHFGQLVAAHTVEAGNKRKQAGMASGSGEVEREQFEEAPGLFKSLVWEHFGFAVEYTDEGVKTVKRNFTV